MANIVVYVQFLATICEVTLTNNARRRKLTSECPSWPDLVSCLHQSNQQG